MAETKVLIENETRRITEDRIFGRFLEGKNKFGRWVVMSSFANMDYSKYEDAKTVWNEVVLQKFITLSNGQIKEVPEGADPKYFRKFEEAKLRRQGKPKRRKAGSRTRRNSRKTNYAQQVIARGKAIAELVERVNEDD